MIAKITSGGGFRGALDYLLNSKQKEREERAQEREKERQQQGRAKEVERTPPAEAARREEATTREEAKLTDEPRHDEPKAGQRQQPQSQIEERELHPERGRDLGDEYESGQRHRIIGGNMSGQNPRELSREFGLVRELRPAIEKPVHHVSISAGENDRLSVEQWQEIADTYIEKMGFKNAPHVVIQHRGTGRDHIHILASRIDFDGKVIGEWQSKRRAEKVMREVENKYDLERLPMSREVMRAAPTRGEQEVFERTGRMSAKVSLQGHVERALREQPTATEFMEKLQRVGVETIPHVQSTGRVSGISFRQGDELMKGSDLGRGFSWGRLQERGLTYEPERDRPAMEAATQRAGMSREPEPNIAQAAPEPEHIFADTPSDVARSAGQYLLDQTNSVNQLQDDFRKLEQLGRNVADGSHALKDLPPEQDNMERLRQAAGLETAGKDVIEQLHEAAGLEPVKGNPDALERLNNAAGVERQDPSSDSLHAPDKALENTPGAPSLAHTIERGVEREAVEQTIERGIELLF
jgi:hypothetical protein